MSIDALREITKANRWLAVAHAVTSGQRSNEFDDDSFATYWIEAGHRVREQVADDFLLVNMLRALLPPYTGGPVNLYRGENLGRWRAKNVGLSWTEDRQVARMFGRGLNAIQAGGVLLRGFFEPTSIICGPNEHSRYLQEEQFTVDISKLPYIEVLEDFPSQ